MKVERSAPNPACPFCAIRRTELQIPRNVAHAAGLIAYRKRFTLASELLTLESVAGVMLRIKHILFPYDFSARCDATAPSVADMARQFGARITLLSIVPPVWDHSSSEPKTAAALFDPQRIQSSLDQALRDQLGGLKVERIWHRGDPAACITDFAHSKRVDLITLPTHGYGPFRSLLLGSVSAKVLHDARCPVWTDVHAPEPSDRPENSASGRLVLCAVDRTPKAVPLMKWAAAWAEAWAKPALAQLRLVHAAPKMTDLPALKSERALQEEIRKEAEEFLEKQRKEAGVEAPACAVVGGVAEAVHEEALRHGAALVVIGRGVLHGTLGRLRTHAYDIIRRSPCPVLSV